MSTLTVGAAGAGGVFDYTCDGTADDVEINAAIGAAGAGDTVQLSDGTFTCAAKIDALAGVSLIGSGDTVFQFPTSGATKRIYAWGPNTIGDFEMLGRTALIVLGSNVSVSAVVSRQLYDFCAFGIWVMAGVPLVENVTFDHCDAIDTTGTGFEVFDSPTTDGALDDVTISNCTAVNCGARYDGQEGYRDFVCGFAPSECQHVALSNILLTDCHAEGNYMNGFHVDFAAGVDTCQMVRCTSADNGHTKPGLGGGAGIRIEPGWTATDCTSTHDGIGLSLAWDPTVPEYGPTVATGCQIINPTRAGISVYYLDGGGVDGCSVSGCHAPVPTVLFTEARHNRISDLDLADCDGLVVEAGSTCSDNVVTFLRPAFTVSTPAPVTGEIVAFADALSFGDAGWSWDFGDGHGAAALAPTHAYPTAGAYPVAMTVGGQTVSQTITVVPGVSYGGARLSEADLGPLDHDPVANATDLQNGGVRLQGSPVSRRQWTINALADDHAEIEALAALKGQHLVLNLNGTEYQGVMIRPPMLETQLTPSAWAYQIGLVQETRR